jgi:alginate O-acetyltransferase complex protein AlgI
MLFNSYEFIFFFLPVTVAGFFAIGSMGHHRVAIVWLILASLFFYAWWSPVYLWLIVVSILLNYGFGIALAGSHPKRRTLLVVAIAVNLGLLGYFKYANFFIDTLNKVASLDLRMAQVVLPLAISFHTFQQIAYLVDAYRGETREYNFLHYFLFVIFFPQLIAGPIVHHRELLPQFARDAIYRLNAHNVSVGVTVFIIGLFKKVILADSLAVYASPVFAAASVGQAPTLFEAWGGALAYTFQLYFDFSGYSDMAIGVGYLFGIALPLNFHSPYKATSIIDFWRRWHMTLSRFLHHYLYVPLGGNRRGAARRYANLMVVMLLGGLWHGAGWTFVVWGGLHGIYLCVNHGWRALRSHGVLSKAGAASARESILGRMVGGTLTFIAVVVAWVFFRAETLSAAILMLKGMAGLNGAQLDARLSEVLAPLLGWIEFKGHGIGVLDSPWVVAWLLLAAAITWLSPNVHELLVHTSHPRLPQSVQATDQGARLQWRPNFCWATITGLAAAIAVFGLTRESEFLYFQF